MGQRSNRRLLVIVVEPSPNSARDAVQALTLCAYDAIVHGQALQQTGRDIDVVILVHVKRYVSVKSDDARAYLTPTTVIRSPYYEHYHVDALGPCQIFSDMNVRQMVFSPMTPADIASSLVDDDVAFAALVPLAYSRIEFQSESKTFSQRISDTLAVFQDLEIRSAVVTDMVHKIQSTDSDWLTRLARTPSYRISDSFELFVRRSLVETFVSALSKTLTVADQCGSLSHLVRPRDGYILPFAKDVLTSGALDDSFDVREQTVTYGSYFLPQSQQSGYHVDVCVTSRKPKVESKFPFTWQMYLELTKAARTLGCSISASEPMTRTMDAMLMHISSSKFIQITCKYASTMRDQLNEILSDIVSYTLQQDSCNSAGRKMAVMLTAMTMANFSVLQHQYDQHLIAIVGACIIMMALPAECCAAYQLFGMNEVRCDNVSLMGSLATSVDDVSLYMHTMLNVIANNVDHMSLSLDGRHNVCALLGLMFNSQSFHVESAVDVPMCRIDAACYRILFGVNGSNMNEIMANAVVHTDTLHSITCDSMPLQWIVKPAIQLLTDTVLTCLGRAHVPLAVYLLCNGSRFEDFRSELTELNGMSAESIKQCERIVFDCHNVSFDSHMLSRMKQMASSASLPLTVWTMTAMMWIKRHLNECAYASAYHKPFSDVVSAVVRLISETSSMNVAVVYLYNQLLGLGVDHNLEQVIAGRVTLPTELIAQNRMRNLMLSYYSPSSYDNRTTLIRRYISGDALIGHMSVLSSSPFKDLVASNTTNATAYHILQLSAHIMMSTVSGPMSVFRSIITCDSMSQLYLPGMPDDERYNALHAVQDGTTVNVCDKCGMRYLIGDCGGANQVGKCTCGAAIGGIGHQLQSGNRREGQQSDLTPSQVEHGYLDDNSTTPIRALGANTRLLTYLLMECILILRQCYRNNQAVDQPNVQVLLNKADKHLTRLSAALCHSNVSCTIEYLHAFIANTVNGTINADNLGDKSSRLEVESYLTNTFINLKFAPKNIDALPINTTVLSSSAFSIRGVDSVLWSTCSSVTSSSSSICRVDNELVCHLGALAEIASEYRDDRTMLITDLPDDERHVVQVLCRAMQLNDDVTLGDAMPRGNHRATSQFATIMRNAMNEHNETVIKYSPNARTVPISAFSRVCSLTVQHGVVRYQGCPALDIHASIEYLTGARLGMVNRTTRDIVMGKINQMSMSDDTMRDCVRESKSASALLNLVRNACDFVTCYGNVSHANKSLMSWIDDHLRSYTDHWFPGVSSESMVLKSVTFSQLLSLHDMLSAIVCCDSVTHESHSSSYFAGINSVFLHQCDECLNDIDVSPVHLLSIFSLCNVLVFDMCAAASNDINTEGSVIDYLLNMAISVDVAEVVRSLISPDVKVKHACQLLAEVSEQLVDEFA